MFAAVSGRENIINGQRCAWAKAVTAKSPLTGAVGMGLSGGHFPVELKFAGYDVLKNTDCRQRQTQTSQKNFHKSDEGQ